MSDLEKIVEDIWELARSGENWFERPAFIRLRDYCVATYPNAGSEMLLSFAMSNMLRSLCIPVGLQSARTALAMSPDKAAARIDAAFTSTHARRTHMCPLDWADELPEIAFGPATLRRFSAGDLMELFDAPRLERVFPNKNVKWERLAAFQWLVVVEDVPLVKEPGERAMPIFYQPLAQDLGAFRPHEGRHPALVEDALFFLLLAPWEDWCEALEVDWRGFRLPWIYTVDDDLFVKMQAPPQHETLSWEPDFYESADGEVIEEEKPASYMLAGEAADLATEANQHRWEGWLKVKDGVLFEPPVAHFLVRGFLSAGIDEFLAHFMVIEAALGLETDYGPKQKGQPHSNLSVTRRVVRRIANLLDDCAAGTEYRRLFELRSAYVHGRSMLEISSDDLGKARGLARRVAARLVQVACGGGLPETRDEYLMSLLD